MSLVDSYSCGCAPVPLEDCEPFEQVREHEIQVAGFRSASGARC